MVFDLLSFLAGIVAGLATGALAGILHGLERTADLQERLRRVNNEVDVMRNRLLASPGGGAGKDSEKFDELQKDLEEIHEEIRRMYKRTNR